MSRACPMMGMSGTEMGACPMEGCPMMGAPSPRAALEKKEELGLSARQVEALEKLTEDLQKTRSDARERLRAARERVDAVKDRERYDEAALRAAFEDMGKARAELGVAKLRAEHEMKSILAPEQQSRLADSAQEGMMQRCQAMMGMMGMMGMMHGGGDAMEGCPMMGP